MVAKVRSLRPASMRSIMTWPSCKAHHIKSRRAKRPKNPANKYLTTLNTDNFRVVATAFLRNWSTWNGKTSQNTAIGNSVNIDLRKHLVKVGSSVFQVRFGSQKGMSPQTPILDSSYRLIKLSYRLERDPWFMTLSKQRWDYALLRPRFLFAEL